MPPQTSIVLDWDGTVTERDTLVMLLEAFGAPAADGSATFREVMETEMATLRLPLEEAVAWLGEHARVRPGFRELAEAYRPLIVSSSFEETIRPLLEREGVDLEVVANRVDARPDGWRVLWRDDAPCPQCGDLCKRSALPDPPFVYVGDGWSDRCAALAADRVSLPRKVLRTSRGPLVFARDGLARYLDEQGVEYEAFEDLRDVVAALA